MPPSCRHRQRVLANRYAHRLSEVSLLDTIAVDPATRSAAQAYVYVVKALEVVPGIGKVRARAIMREIGIEERCNIGSLTDDQRRLLQEALQS